MVFSGRFEKVILVVERVLCGDGIRRIFLELFWIGREFFEFRVFLWGGERIRLV